MKTTFNLPDETSIGYTRTFRAPVQRVWDAYTTPETVRTWMLGPTPGTTFEVCDMDIRSGGGFRWVWQYPEGRLEISGDVLEIEAPHRLVTTEQMSDVDLPASRHEITLTTDGYQTVLTGKISYASTEARDAAHASGMDAGMDASFDRLDQAA